MSDQKRVIAKSKLAGVAGPSLQQAIFTLVSFVATAYVAREAGVRLAAVCFATYAFQSVVATGLRAYLVRGFTFVHESPRLCRGDVVVSAVRVTLISGLWMLASMAVVLSFTGLSTIEGLAIGIWTTAATFCDVFRAMVAVFAPSVFDFVSCIALLVVVLGIALLGHLSVELFLFFLAIVLFLYGWSSLVTLYAGSLRLGSCKVWSRSKNVCWTFVIEDGTYSIAPALTLLVFSVKGPDLVIGLQLATQAILSPAGLIAYGAGIYLLRTVGVRERSSRGVGGVILSWVAIVVGANVLLLAFAETLGSDIFYRIFGSQWGSASTLLVPAVTFFVVTECCRVWANKYRARLSSNAMRLFSMSSVLLGQVAIISIVLATTGRSGVSTSFYVAAVVVLVYSFGWFVTLRVKLRPARRMVTVPMLQATIDGRSKGDTGREV